MRVAIVNDSPMALEGVRRVISMSQHQVAWLARDGAEAVWRAQSDTPDLILMDLIMPVMDGVEATRKIMQQSPCAILVVTATVSGNASKVFQAMGFGALDAVNTPVLGLDGQAQGCDELLAKIGTIEKLLRQTNKPGHHVASYAMAPPAASGRGLVAIGASSGGPQALSTVLSKLPADFSSPVVIVQHVDPNFSQELARWLDSQCALDVRLAKEGDELLAGRVLVAGSGDHLILTASHRLSYTPHPREMPYRPSVDVFFDSVVQHWNHSVVGVLLTGMGRDGAQGLLQLRDKGGHTIAQDEATSTVYGMPKAAAQIGAAVEILPLNDIAPALLNFYTNQKNGCRVS